MALVLGVDIGQSSIKAVVLRTLVRGYEPVLFRRADLPPSRGPRTAEEVGTALAAIIDSGGITGDLVVSSLPGAIASIHFLNLPFTDRKKIEKVVPFEVEAHIPFPLEGMEVAHQVIERKGAGVRALVVVAAMEAIRAHLECLRAANLEPSIVDCDLLALYSLGVARVPADPSLGTYAIVDLGATHTGLVVVAGQKLVAARSLGLGGNTVSNGLGLALGIPFEDAERTKVEFGSVIGLEAGLGASPGSDARKFAEGIRSGLDGVVRELKLALLAVEGKERAPVERVYIAGGGAKLGGVSSYLSACLGTEVRNLDLGVLPVGELPIGESAPPQGPEAACALGLALRGVRGLGGSTLNLRKGEFAYRREVREIAGRVLPLAWPIALILVLAAASLLVRTTMTSSRFQALRKERSALFAQSFHVPEGPDPMRQAKQLIEERRKKLSLLGGAYGPLESLREVAVRTPPDAHVLMSEFDSDPERVTCTALADSFEKVGKVKDDLSKSPDFAKVEVTNQTKDKDQVRFTVAIQLVRGSE